MNEYDPMNYECSPEEPASEPTYTPEPEPQEPVYRPYNPVPDPENKKQKKDRTGVKILALVAVVAVLGSIGGALLTNFIQNIKDESAMPEDPESLEEMLEDYTLAVHKLPGQLSSNDTGKTLSPVEVYEQTVNSVVGIKTEATTNVFGQEAVSASAGSGFILSEDGYVITNSHVVAGADTIQVELFNDESYPAELVGADSSFDIAVLKIEAEGLRPVTVGDSDTLKVGEDVVAIGNPLGELTFTMTSGILSALDREINTDGNPQNMIQTNAAINSGNSGGPLFDMDGNVIGVTTAKYSGSTTSGTTIEGLGFAIPINTALKVAYDLAEHGYVRDQAYLGVTVSTLDTQTASYYGLPVGPRVEGVNAGSCAEKAGLKVGDIVISFNGIKTATHPELLAALKKSQAGDTVEMEIYRAGAQMTLTVVLDEKPSQQEVDAQTEEYRKQQEQQQQQPQVQPQQPQVIDPFEYFFGESFDPFGFGN